MLIDICTGCEKNRLIVNKRYNLCQSCNQNRLDPDHVQKKIAKQIEYNNKQQQKQKEKIKSSSSIVSKSSIKLKPKKSVNRLSIKEAAKKKVLHETYQNIDNERDQCCSGCGRSDVPLSHSHIISRHQNKSLESDEENIVYDCLTMGNRKGCHDIWEHGKQQEKKDKLLNYQARMEYIYKKDIHLFNRLKAKENG